VCNITVNDEYLEQIDAFVYLGSMFTRDGKTDRDIERRVNAGNSNSINGGLNAVAANVQRSEGCSPQWSADINPNAWIEVD